MTAIAFALDAFAPFRNPYFWYEEKSELAAALLFLSAFAERLRLTWAEPLTTPLSGSQVPAALPPSIER